MKKRIISIIMFLVILTGAIFAHDSIDVHAASNQRINIISGKKITSFKTYYNDVLKKKYGAFKKKQTGTMRRWNDRWMKIKGVMGAAVQDFDSDGKKEMMVWVAEKLSDGESSKIMLQMYEKGAKGIGLASEIYFAPYRDGTEVDYARGDITLSTYQSEEASFIINFVKRGKKRYIVCENKLLQETFADGSERDYWILEYKKNRFKYISSFTQLEGGSSDFEYAIFDKKNGNKRTIQFYCSDGHVYDTAIKKYFGKYDIKLNRNAIWSVEVSGKSILLKDKRNVQLFSFQNKRIKGDWKKQVYKFRATVKGLNNL